MIKQSFEINDLKFPFDEKFYFFNHERAIIYYNYEHPICKYFLKRLSFSMANEGKNVLYITKKNYNDWLKPNVLNFNADWFSSTDTKIINKNLKKFADKKIDCVFIEDLQQVNVGIQLPKLLLEFNISEAEKSDIILKKKILERLKILNPSYIIIGNSNFNSDLSDVDFDFCFKIFLQNDKIKYNLKDFTLRNKHKLIYHPIISFYISDLKNKYKNYIKHEFNIMSLSDGTFIFQKK